MTRSMVAAQADVDGSGGLGPGLGAPVEQHDSSAPGHRGQALWYSSAVRRTIEDRTGGDGRRPRAGRARRAPRQREGPRGSRGVRARTTAERARARSRGGRRAATTRPSIVHRMVERDEAGLLLPSCRVGSAAACSSGTLEQALGCWVSAAAARSRSSGLERAAMFPQLWLKYQRSRLLPSKRSHETWRESLKLQLLSGVMIMTMSAPQVKRLWLRLHQKESFRPSLKTQRDPDVALTTSTGTTCRPPADVIEVRPAGGFSHPLLNASSLSRSSSRPARFFFFDLDHEQVMASRRARAVVDDDVRENVGALEVRRPECWLRVLAESVRENRFSTTPSPAPQVELDVHRPAWRECLGLACQITAIWKTTNEPRPLLEEHALAVIRGLNGGTQHSWTWVLSIRPRQRLSRPSRTAMELRSPLPAHSALVWLQDCAA